MPLILVSGEEAAETEPAMVILEAEDGPLGVAVFMVVVGRQITTPLTIITRKITLPQTVKQQMLTRTTRVPTELEASIIIAVVALGVIAVKGFRVHNTDTNPTGVVNIEAALRYLSALSTTLAC